MHSILDLFLPCSSSENNKTFVFTNNKWLFLFKLEPNGFKTGKNFFSFVVLVLIWIFWDNGEFHRKKKKQKNKKQRNIPHILYCVIYNRKGRMIFNIELKQNKTIAPSLFCSKRCIYTIENHLWYCWLITITSKW